MWRHDEHVISTDKGALDVELIHRFISEESYWGLGRSREAMVKAIANSAYCFGLFRESDGGMAQIGFARVVSDMGVFGYVADVFVLAEHRGKGLGKWLIRSVIEHMDAEGLRKIVLTTSTPGFYTDCGFTVVDATLESKLMQRIRN